MEIFDLYSQILFSQTLGCCVTKVCYQMLGNGITKIPNIYQRQGQKLQQKLFFLLKYDIHDLGVELHKLRNTTKKKFLNRKND